MAFFKFPYSNMHNLNLDWVISTLKELESKVNAVGTSELYTNVSEVYGTSESAVELAFSEAVDGDVLYFDNNTFTMPQVAVDKSITLLGYEAVLVASSGLDTYLMDLQSDVKVLGLEINGNRDFQSLDHALIRVSAKDCVIKDCKFTKAYDKIIMSEELGQRMMIVNNILYDNGQIANCNAITCKSSNSLISGNIIEMLGDGWGVRVGRFSADASYIVENVLVSNNIVKNTDHVAYGAELDSEYCTFIGNVSDGAEQVFKCDDSSHISCIDNVFKNSPIGTAFNMQNCPNSNIVGNMLDACGSGITSDVDSIVMGNRISNVELAGIVAKGNSIVKGNIVSDSEADGIRVSGDNVTIVDNIIKTTVINGNSGIKHSEGDKVIITGNHIINDGGSYAIGVRLYSSTIDAIIKNNAIDATTDISNASTGTSYVSDNI